MEHDAVLTQTQTQTLRLVTGDGESIVALEYLPTYTPLRDVIFINPAMGVRQSFYKDIALFFAARGYAVVTYDYRGVGQSLLKPIRSYRDRTAVWGEQDITAVIECIKARHPEARLIALSHSIGGQMLGLSRRVNEVDFAVNVAVQSGYFGLWSGWAKIKLWMLWSVFVPTLSHALGYYPAKRLGMGENISQSMMLEWAKWCRQKDYMFDKKGPRSVANFRKLRAPVYSISITDDAIAPRKSVEYMNEKYPNLLRHEVLEPRSHGMKSLGHFGYFRKGAQPLWLELEREIARRAA